MFDKFLKNVNFIWATAWENLFLPYANNKGADQPAHCWAGQFEYYLVGNPKDRFSHDVAPLNILEPWFVKNTLQNIEVENN